MGDYNETCAATGVYIRNGAPAMCLFKANDDYAGEAESLLPLPVYGNYDGYGRLEDGRGPCLPLVLKLFKVKTLRDVFDLAHDGKGKLSFFDLEAEGSPLRRLYPVFLSMQAVDEILANHKSNWLRDDKLCSFAEAICDIDRWVQHVLGYCSDLPEATRRLMRSSCAREAPSSLKCARALRALDTLSLGTHALFTRDQLFEGDIGMRSTVEMMRDILRLVWIDRFMRDIRRSWQAAGMGKQEGEPSDYSSYIKLLQKFCKSERLRVAEEKIRWAK